MGRHTSTSIIPPEGRELCTDPPDPPPGLWNVCQLGLRLLCRAAGEVGKGDPARPGALFGLDNGKRQLFKSDIDCSGGMCCGTAAVWSWGLYLHPHSLFRQFHFLAESGVPWFLCRSEGPSCAISVPPAPARSCCCPSPAPASPALLSAPALIPNSCPCYSWAGLRNRLVPTGAR